MLTETPPPSFPARLHLRSSFVGVDSKGGKGRGHTNALEEGGGCFDGTVNALGVFLLFLIQYSVAVLQEFVTLLVALVP